LYFGSFLSAQEFAKVSCSTTKAPSLSTIPIREDMIHYMKKGNDNKGETAIPRDFNEGREPMRGLFVRNTFLDVSYEDSWMVGTNPLLRRQQTDSILDQRRDELAGSSCKVESQLPECSWMAASKVESFIPDIMTVPMATRMDTNEDVNDRSDEVEEDLENLQAPESSSRVSPEIQAMRHAAAQGGGVSGCTTVMMKDVPLKYTQRKLIREINSLGFMGLYDFLYLPMDSRTHANRGFAFINMVSVEAAEEFHKKLHGQFLRHFSTNAENAISILPADLQGFEENALQYANTINQGKRTGHTKPAFFRPLPRHIEAKLQENKPSAPPMQERPVAVAQRLPQRPMQQAPKQDAREVAAAVLQQALLPLLKASLSRHPAPQQPNFAAQEQPSFCAYCGKKRFPDHVFCAYCGRQFN
jgi:hypothetical protein